MTTLPQSLEEIIHKYHHQLKMNDIMKDLIVCSYTCSCCYELKHKSIKIYKNFDTCSHCSQPICIDCKINNYIDENSLNECTECYYNEKLINKISSIIKKKITDEQYDFFYNFIEDIELIDYTNIFQFLDYNFGDIISQNTIYIGFNELLDDIEAFINGSFEGDIIIL